MFNIFTISCQIYQDFALLLVHPSFHRVRTYSLPQKWSYPNAYNHADYMHGHTFMCHFSKLASFDIIANVEISEALDKTAMLSPPKIFEIEEGESVSHAALRDDTPPVLRQREEFGIWPWPLSASSYSATPSPFLVLYFSTTTSKWMYPNLMCWNLKLLPTANQRKNTMSNPWTFLLLTFPIRGAQRIASQEQTSFLWRCSYHHRR